jgi:hypothetical protein|tara:strand:- start:1469 stop:1645 length:177 start_codon:yes stop_codon:yes gene_type:complete
MTGKDVLGVQNNVLEFPGADRIMHGAGKLHECEHAKTQLATVQIGLIVVDIAFLLEPL